MKTNKLWLGVTTIAIVLVGGLLFLTKERVEFTYEKVDLDRPLVIGVSSWPGYIGGITANRGFKENLESTFYKKYGLPVRFELMDDIDARGKAFAKGGPDGIDVVWTTIDFWANELPGYNQGGIEAAAFMQTDWSRGGDAMVSDNSIKSVEDLVNKKVSLVQFTPSHWLLETAMRQSKLSSSEKEKIRNNLVFTQDASTARAAFVAGQVDATVTWEPDVTQALERSNSHILLSSEDFPNAIIDVLSAKKEFLETHPKAVEAFIRGWMDGTEEALENPDLAAKLLMENEPLFEDLGIEKTKESFSWVTLANLQDNIEMFGSNNSKATFDYVFTDSSEVWKSLGLIDQVITPTKAKDASILQKIYNDSR